MKETKLFFTGVNTTFYSKPINWISSWSSLTVNINYTITFKLMDPSNPFTNSSEITVYAKYLGTFAAITFSITTGKEITYNSGTNLIKWSWKYEMDPNTFILQITSPTYDATIYPTWSISSPSCYMPTSQLFNTAIFQTTGKLFWAANMPSK